MDCGGQGFFSLELAKVSVFTLLCIKLLAQTLRLPYSFPSLHFVIQDLPEVVSVTESHILEQLPQAASVGRVIAEVQDFFKPQTRMGDEYTTSYFAMSCEFALVL